MSDSIGARLREARELRRLTLQQVSETTRLRIHYLQALENDDYSAIPSAAQARGFLRIYAGFLELDVADMLAALQAAAPVVEPAGAAPAPTANTQGMRPNLWAAFRDRLTHRGTQTEEIASVPSDSSAAPAAQPADQAAAVPASSEAQTTRRTKAAAAGVKKNAAR